MADNLTLNDITQTQFDAAEAAGIDLIRSAFPSLDLRKGTAVREVQVRPDAAMAALNQERVDRLRRVMSLATIAEDQTATEAEINAILANFNMTRAPGTPATGVVRVVVDTARTYTLAAGFKFTALSGAGFTVSANVTARPAPAAGEVAVVSDGDNYSFDVPVVADATGSTYNIAEGTSLTPTTYVYGVINASAATSFSGGRDGESIEDAISRIPASLSHRSLTSETAIEAQLRARFDSEVYIRALSVVGFGNPAQLRDKHNVFGVAVGNRCDVYPRTFSEPVTLLLTKTGTKTGPGTYSFHIDASDAPGFHAIKTVIDAQDMALSSYDYTLTRTAAGVENQHAHDIQGIESFGTVFQEGVVDVRGVADVADTHDFSVEVYVTPYLAEMQAYVDSASVKSVNADVLVRAPLICFVTCTANVYIRLGQATDVEALKRALVDYINGRSFTSRLTRSELASVLLGAGVERVDLSDKGMVMQGRVVDAYGVEHILTGDSLNLDVAATPTALLTADTCVFAAELRDMHINGVTA